jgi:gluconolactonase
MGELLETRSVRDLRVVATGLDHPEGVALGPTGRLFAGGEAGQLYCVDPEDAVVEQIADLGGFVAGICLDAAGAVYACGGARGAIMRVGPDGAIEAWCESAGGKPLREPNWAAFQEDGSLIFSDSGSEDVPDGVVVRVPPGGGEGEVLDIGPLFFPNGLAVAADGAIYLVESLNPRLSVLRDGHLEEVCRLPGVVPDGVAIDASGSVLVSCYYPYRIYRVAGAGPELLIDDPLGTRMIMPTNVCYFGDGLTELAIAGLGGHSITALKLPTPGLPLRYP